MIAPHLAAVGLLAILVSPTASASDACAPGETTLLTIRETATASEPFPAGGSFGGQKLDPGTQLCATELLTGTDLNAGRTAWTLTGGMFISTNEVADLPDGWNSAFPEQRAATPSVGLFGGAGVQELRVAPSKLAEKVVDLDAGTIVDVNMAATVTDAAGNVWVPVRVEGGSIGWLDDAALTAEIPTTEPSETSPAPEASPAEPTTEAPAAGAPPFEVPRLALAAGGVVALVALFGAVSAVLRRRRRRRFVSPAETTTSDVGLPPAPLDHEE